MDSRLRGNDEAYIWIITNNLFFGEAPGQEGCSGPLFPSHAPGRNLRRARFLRHAA